MTRKYKPRATKYPHLLEWAKKCLVGQSHIVYESLPNTVRGRLPMLTRRTGKRFSTRTLPDDGSQVWEVMITCTFIPEDGPNAFH